MAKCDGLTWMGDYGVCDYNGKCPDGSQCECDRCVRGKRPLTNMEVTALYAKFFVDDITTFIYRPDAILEYTEKIWSHLKERRLTALCAGQPVTLAPMEVKV